MQSRKLPLSLHTTLRVAIFVLTGLGLTVSGVLIALTTRLQSTGMVLRASVESVRLAQESEILLLVHGRAADPVVRSEIEGEMERALAHAGDHVTTSREAAVLREAETRVRDYLDVARRESPAPLDLQRHQDWAYRALEALVEQNVAQAEAAAQEAARWDRFANVLGVTTAILPLALAGWLLWWLRTRAFRPLFGLAGAMERFGRGERDVRAEESGPLEIHEMAARFNAMASDLAAQREVLITFLAGVAHDLRNPLAVLATSMSAMPPDKPLPPEPRIRRTLDVLSRQLVRMDRMLGDFLDMATLEAGKLELRMVTCDARALVREVAELFDTTSPRHQVEISLPDAEVPVRCDPLRMEQVLTNLLGNAIKYSPEGGSIAVTLVRREDFAVLELTDRGIGMSEDEQRLLFEPFRRHGATRDAVPGSGLGLFGVKRIVEAHGGGIEVESAPGRGSTFRVRLTIAPEARGSDHRTPGGAGVNERT